MDGVPREQVSAQNSLVTGIPQDISRNWRAFPRNLSTILRGLTGEFRMIRRRGQFRTQQGIRAERIYRVSRATGAKAAEPCAVKPGQALKRFVPATSLHAQAKLTFMDITTQMGEPVSSSSWSPPLVSASHFVIACGPAGEATPQEMSHAMT